MADTTAQVLLERLDSRMEELLATHSAAAWGPSQVKELTEIIFVEKDRALGMAGEEREKAASALRVEQQRREDQATAERDKAAINLQVELARAIKEGDDRLREHIANQFAQIDAALISADKLEVERLSRADSDIHALAEKLEVLRVAQASAQDKFERSVESRFAQVNEFRSALDDLGKTMATRRELEEKEKSISSRIDDGQRQIGELRSRLDIGPEGLKALQSKTDLSSGNAAGRQVTMGNLATWIGVAVAIIVAVIVFANYETSHSSPSSPAVVCTASYHPAPCPQP